MRNTVAHELVHSLAFRPSEFGVDLKAPINSKENLSDVIDAIEKETEKLSPLLLLSDRAIENLLSDKKQPLTVEDLTQVCEVMGLSRHVLVSRLRLIRPTDSSGFRQYPGLRNTGIGIGEWVDRRVAVIRSWPQFWNFDRNVVPAFLLKSFHQDRIPATDIFFDKTFEMCGGWNHTIELETPAGVPDTPDAEQFKVRVSIELADKKANAQFLFAVTKLTKS
jgi:hypothetical protein